MKDEYIDLGVIATWRINIRERIAEKRKTA